MVDLSPWPLLCCVFMWAVSCRVLVFINSGGALELGLCVFMVILVLYQWWRDVVRESTLQGEHTSKVVNGLYYGIVLFILSELMFFFSFFFGVFFVCLSPDVSLGCNWPPAGVESLSCFSVPLLNTVLLVSSGVSITWAHHSLISGFLKETSIGLAVTIGLGVVFIYVQVGEYFETSFSAMDSVYGSFFFLITGFHGLHVLVGLVFISVAVVRLFFLHFSNEHAVGFEMAVWYWHFVDVVWLFLFISVYWWGGT